MLSTPVLSAVLPLAASALRFWIAFRQPAGREICILVQREKISDEATVWLFSDVARSIENGRQYSGQITLVRETRAVEFAH